ncbi:MAG: hypothetical protein KatS3mg054_0922 [Chloroflexus sp.]|nr:MAG: hypothetical protein KatS3mg040_1855 [Candidatus Kapabacteria bacterium]GIV86893.1 MAG: hypothetical protein KatS3mg054_0922 [Chloroflexus sp.]
MVGARRASSRRGDVVRCPSRRCDAVRHPSCKGDPTGRPYVPHPHIPYPNHHHGTSVRVGATWCVACGALSKMVGARHAVPRRAVPQPSPRHAGSRRGDVMRCPHRVAHCVGATRCVAHRVGLPIASGRGGALPIGLGRRGALPKMVGARQCHTPTCRALPPPRHAGSRRGDAVRRPLRCVAHRVGATRCVAHRVGATRCVAHRVGARHAVPLRAAPPHTVPQPSPRHAGSRRGDAVRCPSDRVAHRVGATRCVAQNGWGTACRAPTCRTPPAVPQPSPRRAGSRRGDAVRCPSGRVVHRVGATRCVAHCDASPIGSGCPSGWGDVVRCPLCKGDPPGRPYVPHPHIPYPNHHHGVPVRVGATRCVAHRVGLPIGSGRRGALPIASGRRGALPIGSGHGMPCPYVPHPRIPYPNHHHGTPVRVGATWCVAHRIGLPIASGRRGALPIAMRRPSGRVAHRVGATRCVVHCVRATHRVAPTCRTPTYRTPTITTARRFASGRRGALPIGSGCPSGWGDAVRRPLCKGDPPGRPYVPHPIGRTPTITTARRFASGRRGALPIGSGCPSGWGDAVRCPSGRVVHRVGATRRVAPT